MSRTHNQQDFSPVVRLSTHAQSYHKIECADKDFGMQCLYVGASFEIGGETKLWGIIAENLAGNVCVSVSNLAVM